MLINPVLTSTGLSPFQQFKKSQLYEAFLDPKVWLIFAINLVLNIPNNGVLTVSSLSLSTTRRLAAQVLTLPIWQSIVQLNHCLTTWLLNQRNYVDGYSYRSHFMDFFSRLHVDGSQDWQAMLVSIGSHSRPILRNNHSLLLAPFERRWIFGRTLHSLLLLGSLHCRTNHYGECQQSYGPLDALFEVC